MLEIISSAKRTFTEHTTLPFSIYTSQKEQHILNIPIIKPLLILVLDGKKQLGQNNTIECTNGNFVFLSNSAKVEMRNIPSDSEYLALLIEFEFSDFECFKNTRQANEVFFNGEINRLLEQFVLQFIEWSTFSPQALWPSRRQELLQLIYHLGYTQVATIAEPPNLSHKVDRLIRTNLTKDFTAVHIGNTLAMSESTLRRKLSNEGTNLQSIKDQVKLGHGLHLIQTTYDAIGLIAEQCGYTSQSRFTDKFKQLFGMTPSELRKTRLSE